MRKNSQLRRAGRMPKVLLTACALISMSYSQSISVPVPFQVVATPISATQIQVTWEGNASLIDGFCIEYKYSTRAFVQVAVASANTKSGLMINLTQNILYSFRVRAFKDQAFSLYSNVASAKTPYAILAKAISPEELQKNAIAGSAEAFAPHILRIFDARGCCVLRTNVSQAEIHDWASFHLVPGQYVARIETTTGRAQQRFSIRGR